jgi:hypothetical protein
MRRLLLISLIGIAACKRTDTAPRPVESVVAAPITVAAVAAGAAFDLIETQDGPLLVWAAPADAGGGVFVRDLDARGVARKPERRIAGASAASEVIEIEAAAVHDQVGVAFLESDGVHGRTRALLLPPDDRTAMPEPTLLAESAPLPPRGRGHIALAAVRDAALRLLYPTGRADCVEPSQGECVGFAFQELGAAANAPRAPFLSVPSPCPEGAATACTLPGRWFYAVCSWNTDAPSTMAYSINTETYYARADEVLRGCTPLGMIALDAETVLLTADCNAMRRAVRLSLDMRPAAEFPLADVALACDGDRPVIRASGFSLALDRARDHLEGLLPASLAPTGARALWTGSALLIAHRPAQQLQVDRYACVGGALRASFGGTATASGATPSTPPHARSNGWQRSLTLPGLRNKLRGLAQ